MKLHELSNTSRPRKACKRVGRGIGSKIGKTCGRGHKGAGSRAGWKSRARYEGGQLPLYRKTPERGFTRGRFLKRLESINLEVIDNIFEDGETVSVTSLIDRGYFGGKIHGLKILGAGELTKKVSIEATAVSASAKEKLDRAGISITLV
jgi:large subunit ribosomal protein L15